MQTTPLNPTLQHAFRIIIPEEKQLMYDIVDLQLPGLTLSKTLVQYQNSIMNVPDDVLMVDDISFSIILSDGLSGYIRLLKWLKKARNHETGFRKDVSILIFNGDFSEQTGELSFFNTWPTTIGSFQMDYSIPDAAGVRVSVTLSVDGDYNIS